MNIFTNDDYRKIQAWLKANAIKDSELTSVDNTIPEEDTLVLIQKINGILSNVKISIKNLLNSTLSKIIIDTIIANAVKVNNILTVTASNVKIDNEKGTTLQDIIDWAETIENTAKGWNIEYQAPSIDEPTVRAKYVLKDSKGVPKGDIIKVYKDSAVTNVYLGTTEDICNENTGEVTKKSIQNNNEALSIVYRLDTGKYSLVNVPIGIFIREAEFDKYRGLGITENGQVFIKLANDVESSNYLHFNDSGELSADGIENRILQDLGTIINSVVGDGTMWGQYKKEEGTKDSPTNEASRWGQYKQAEADRNERLNNLENKIEEEKTAIIDTNRIANGAVTISKLSTDIQALIANISKNAVFAGIATPTTNPGTPDGPVFYIATEAGTYSNFGGISVANGKSVILEWKGSWVKKVTGFASEARVSNIGVSKQSVLGNLFSKEASADDIYDLSLFILDMKYVGTSLDKNIGYSIYECRKSDDNLALKFGIMKENGSVFDLSTNPFLLSDIPTDYTKNYHQVKIGDFEFVFNWDYFKDFLYTKGRYPSRKLNNSFIFSPNVINKRFKQIDTNTAEIVQNTAEIVQNTADIKELNVEAFKRSEAVIDEVNLYNSLNNENGFIIREGEDYNKSSYFYYSVTDFLPYDSKRTWEYSGCTTGNYGDKGCIAYFSEKSEESYLGAKLIPNSPAYKPLTDDFPEAKFIKFTLRKIDATDIKNFTYYRKSVDIVSLKNDVNRLDEKVSTLDIKLLDFSTLVIDAMGDSYTQMGYDNNRGFMFFGAKILGIEKSQINNYGIGGTKIAKLSAEDSNTDTMVNRVSAMKECDIYTILGGYNDSNIPFDNWDAKLGSESTKDDPTTIFGACCGIIEGYRQKYPYSNAIPVLMTYPYAPDTNKKKLNQCLRNVANYYNAPIIDFEKLCGFVEGKNCRIGRPNILDEYMPNWVSGKRPNWQGGTTIETNADWGYIPDYIPRPENAKILWVPINCNLHQYQYTEGVYKWLKQSNSREAKLLDECTHIRFAYYEAYKDKAYIRVEDGTFVCDGDIHPNLLGFMKMATVWAAKMKELLFPKL